MGARIGKQKWLLVIAALLAAGCGQTGKGGQSSQTSVHAGSGSVGSSGSAPTSLHVAAAGWELPTATSRAAVTTDGRNLFVLGGLVTGDISTDQALVIDPSTGALRQQGTIARRLHDAGSAWLNGRSYIFGGGETRTLDTVQVWTAQGGQVLGHLPQVRSDLAAVTVGTSAYIVGGFNGSLLDPGVLATSDGEKFSVVGQLRQSVRYPAVAAVGDSIWIVGGEQETTEGGSGSEITAIQRFDTKPGISTTVAQLPHPLSHASAFVLNGQLFVAGGRQAGQAVSQIVRIDTGTGMTSAMGNLPSPRSDSTSVVVGNTAYLVGGEVRGPTDPLRSVIAINAN